MARGNLNSKTLDILSTCEPFRAARSASRAAHRRGRAIPDTLLRRGSIALLQSMIRKSGRRFSEKIMLRSNGYCFAKWHGKPNFAGG